MKALADKKKKAKEVKKKATGEGQESGSSVNNGVVDGERGIDREKVVDNGGSIYSECTIRIAGTGYAKQVVHRTDGDATEIIPNGLVTINGGEHPYRGADLSGDGLVLGDINDGKEGKSLHDAQAFDDTTPLISPAVQNAEPMNSEDVVKGGELAQDAEPMNREEVTCPENLVTHDALPFTNTEPLIFPVVPNAKPMNGDEVTCPEKVVTREQVLA